MIKKILIGLGVLFVVIIIIGIASGGSKNQPAKVNEAVKTESQPTASQPSEFKVGDIIKLGDREFTVNNVKKAKSLGQFQTAKTGKEYVVVNVTIKNLGKDEVSYNPFDFKLQDSNGAQESQTFATLDDSLNSGTLASGGKVTGSIPFEAPEGDSGLKLIFQPSFWSKDRVIVVL